MIYREELRTYTPSLYSHIPRQYDLYSSIQTYLIDTNLDEYLFLHYNPNTNIQIKSSNQIKIQENTSYLINLITRARDLYGDEK